MNKFRNFINRKSSRLKIIISSITLMLCLLIFLPSVASVDSEYKFQISIKSNELDPNDIDIISIEASCCILFLSG